MKLEKSTHKMRARSRPERNHHQQDQRHQEIANDDDDRKIDGDAFGSINEIGPAPTTEAWDNNVADQKEDDDGGEENMRPIEAIFEAVEVPRWWRQLSLRAFVVSFFLLIIFGFVGVSDGLQLQHNQVILGQGFSASVGFLAFLLVIISVRICRMSSPFTRQENVVILACTMAGHLTSGAFPSLFAMSSITRTQVFNLGSVKNPGVFWMMGFLLISNLLGLFAILPFRKKMIMDTALTYPEATATSNILNSIHTPRTTWLAKKQIKTLFIGMMYSFIYTCANWLVSGGPKCGAYYFPLFGMKAYKAGFFFSFTARGIGIGMFIPPAVHISYVVGFILFFSTKTLAGHGNGSPDFKQIKLELLGCAIVLGGAAYYFTKILFKAIIGLCRRPDAAEDDIAGVEDWWQPRKKQAPVSYNNQRRTHFFLKDYVPFPIIAGAYIALAIVATTVIPKIFPDTKWEHIFAVCILTTPFVFSAARLLGLTLSSMARDYAYLALYAVGAWEGKSMSKSSTAIMAGLVASGLASGIIRASDQTILGFKVGYMTLTSPIAIFASQAVGILMGSLVNPFIFWIFYRNARGVGLSSGSQYPVPEATFLRLRAAELARGEADMPEHYRNLCLAFFLGSLVLTMARDALPRKKLVGEYAPIPMAMAVPFVLSSDGHGAALSILGGGLVCWAWKMRSSTAAFLFRPTVAAGLMGGEMLSSFLQSILLLAKRQPPLCLKYLSAPETLPVISFLNERGGFNPSG